MLEAVLAKFSQHADIRQVLLDTGDALIVEHTRNDSYWADGGDGQGKNMLGQILMQVRERLRSVEISPLMLATSSVEDQMNSIIRQLSGANMDIDLATSPDQIAWQQDQCPWNEDEAEGSDAHKCAVKNVSICRYFCGVKYLDTILCCYPHENPLKD